MPPKPALARRGLAVVLEILLLPAALAALAPRAGLVGFSRVAMPEDVPAHLVSALAQDRTGFLWIGTQGGLVRYDGYGFRVFKPDPARRDSLSGSYVRALHAGRDGRLFVGTFSGGLSLFDPASETFTRFSHDPRDAGSLANNRVEGIAEDRAGGIWAATSDGLDRLDPASGRIEHHRHDPRDMASLASDIVRGLFVDRSGRLWVGTRDGLQLYRGAGRGFARVASDPAVPGSLAGELVTKIYEDRRGRIWVGTAEHGAAALDPRTGALTRLPLRPADPAGLSHFWIYGFAEAAAGEIWVATFGGGIDVLDPESLAVVERLRHDPTLEATVGGDRIGALLADRAGVVWAGTWGQGLAFHDPSSRPLRSLRASPNRPDGLSHPSVVRALEMRDGTIWAGTNGNGIDILSPEGRLLGGLRAAPGDPRGLADGSVTCLGEGADGTAWVATLDGTLHRRRPGEGGFARFTRTDGLAGGPIRALAFGPAGDLWLGSAEGMTRLEAAASPRPRISAFRHDPADPRSLSGRAVEALAFTRDGTLWVGTDAGLAAFDPVRGTAVAIRHEPGRPDGLPDDWVPDLLVASDGRLWVATSGGAAILDAWDGRRAHFTAVAEKIGRRPAPVEALLEDAEGHVWLGPRLRVDPKAWRAQDFGPAEGCTFRSFFIASRARTRNGTLLFGSPEGLLLVDPAAIRPWTYAPPVVVTALRIGGMAVPGASARGRLVLPPAARTFRLDFAALDLTAPQRLRYRYRLEGFDADWSRGDAGERSLAYTRLPPGGYTLRVQGTNRAGVLSPHELRLAVEVPPAFTETAPARAAALALLAGLVYAAYRLRIRQLSARSRELERVVAERTGELAAAYARIEEASLTDPLTGLRNRRFLEQVVGADVELAIRHAEGGGAAEGEADLVFLLLDLDHFKSVNDTHGHAAGDAVLLGLAEILREVFRPSDHLIRWGGEEFLVVARFVDRKSAPDLAERLREAIESCDFLLPDGTSLRRTGSIGFASFPFAPLEPREVDWDKVVELADRALYAAKRSGRNRWVGVEIGSEEGADGVVAGFLTDPAGAAARGDVGVVMSKRPGELRWE